MDKKKEKNEREVKSPGVGEEKGKKFSDLMQNEYKDEFQKKFDREFAKRFKKMRETEEALVSIKKSLAPLIEYYGISDIESLVTLILKDLKKEVLAPSKNNYEGETFEKMYEKWMDEARKTSEIYPECKFSKEFEKPDFVKGLNAGIPMTSLYRALNFDEISKGISEHASKAALENIRAGKGRINEAGIENSPSVRAKKSAGALTDKEIDEILKKVKNGEKITFAE